MKKIVKQPFSVRLDEPLMDALERSARDNCRSLNAEIRFRLMGTFEQKHGVIVVRSPANTNENRGGRNS